MRGYRGRVNTRGEQLRFAASSRARYRSRPRTRCSLMRWRSGASAPR